MKLSFLIIAISLVIAFFYSGCITIKYLPAPCKPDTVYIEKESPLFFRPMPYYEYPTFKWIDTSFNWIDTISGVFILTDTTLDIRTLDTNKAWISKRLYSETSYKKIALKAQQITNND